MRFLPAAFASYNALSAVRISDSASLMSSDGKLAIPMLMVMRTCGSLLTARISSGKKLVKR